MALTLVTHPLPLHLDPDGVVRIGETRITLDTVITAFKNGATAEEIAFQFPSLSLSQIYAVISYYLQDQGSVDKYLLARWTQAAEVRRENESNFSPVGVRDRLLARKKK